jgi:hypothetical protein
MTILTVVAAWNVTARLTGGSAAVMTGKAGTEHRIVVQLLNRTPGSRYMAVLAVVTAWHMIGRLAGRRAAVVTGEATQVLTLET